MLGVGAFYALSIWAPVSAGFPAGWPPAIIQLLTVLVLLAWGLGMLVDRRLEWRSSALDVPVVVLLALVAGQLALGNRPLVDWALSPPGPQQDLVARLPVPFIRVGTVARPETLGALLVFMSYAAVYFFVINRLRTRRDLDHCIRLLLCVGGLLAFAGLIDYLTRDTWLISWGRARHDGRLRATFGNPDHAAVWFAMLVNLGVGYLAARGHHVGHRVSIPELFTVRVARERAVRRYLPLISVVVMALALVFTLSRGGVLSLLLSLLALLWLFWACGRLRWSAALVATLLAAILAYGSWIGFRPLVSRVEETPSGLTHRLEQYRASLPMLKDFPVFGVGLGAYPEIYNRYQPRTHHPERVFYNAAHNDVLQLVIETGALGAVLVVVLGWRVLADLVGAHLLGRGACAVGGGAGDAARRTDSYSVGIAIGAVGGVAALLVHSALDFGARIPANGILAATLLGIGTVAMHARFTHDKPTWLVTTHVLALERRRWGRAALVSILVLAGLGSWAWLASQMGRTEAALGRLSGDRSLGSAEAVLTLDPSNTLALEIRALHRRQVAMDVWTGRVAIAASGDRTHQATALLDQARHDMRAAITNRPTNPYLLHRLAWIESTDAAVNGRVGREGLAPALTYAGRALALAPEEPRLYLALAQFAVTRPEIGLRAAREAVSREPELLTMLVDTFLPMQLSAAQWLVVVAGSPADELRLAALLERRGLARESVASYRKAAEDAAPQDRPVFRWMLARALGRNGDDVAALSELAEALKADPHNGELHFAMANVLARRGDPGALDRFRLAVAKGEEQDRLPHPPPIPFAVTEARLLPTVLDRLKADGDGPSGAIRYRRALAQYLSEQKLWREALAEWQAVIRDRPQDAKAHFSLGGVLESLGASSRALEQYRAAVQLDGASVQFRKSLAARLWADDQYFQAISEWRTVKDLAPNDAEARLALARAYERTGDRIMAFREYLDLLKIHPGDRAATEGIARLRRPAGEQRR